MYEIPAGAKLPVHKHPSPRYAYVLAGTLRVATADESRSWEYKAGDFIVEMIDAWHYGMNTGAEPVRLLVIDQVEAGRETRSCDRRGQTMNTAIPFDGVHALRGRRHARKPDGARAILPGGR